MCNVHFHRKKKCFPHPSCSNLGSRDSCLHHELLGSYSKICNSHLHQIYEFLESRSNPNDLGINHNRHLYNTAIEIVVPRSTAEKLPCFNDYGEKDTLNLEQIALPKKIQDTSLTSTIKKIHMPNILTH